jgi:uncharacterized protein involved in cysteine biosynthesis
MRDVIGGAIDGLRGATYLARHRELWKWVLAPAFVVAVIGFATFGWLVALLGTFGFVRWTTLALASAGVIVTLSTLIAGPFCEMLSEAIEEHETGVTAPAFRLTHFLYGAAVGLAHAARRAFTYVVLLIALLVVAHYSAIAAAAGSAWVTARFASYDCYDAIWARRHWRYRDKLAYLRANLWRTVGLGALVAVALVVPGLNIIALGIGATGATLRVLAREQPPAAPAPRDPRAPDTPR